MARVLPPAVTLPHLRGDADGHHKILILGRTSSEKVTSCRQAMAHVEALTVCSLLKRKTVKRLSRTLSLEVFSLEAEAQKSPQSLNPPDYGASWLIHGITAMGEGAKRALDEATHIICL
jgi:glycine cleavage system H lipoate-binding protein